MLLASCGRLGQLERRERHVLRERVPDQVVAGAEVQRQLVRRPSSRPAPTRRTSTCGPASGSSTSRTRRPCSASRSRRIAGAGELPRVRVERIREERLDVRGNRSAVDGGRAAALVAVARVVEQVQIFAARLQVVVALGVIRKREVVVDRVGVLVAVPRDVAVAVDRGSRGT